jgi:hypothetical protein
MIIRAFFTTVLICGTFQYAQKALIVHRWADVVVAALFATAAVFNLRQLRLICSDEREMTHAR